MEYVIGFIVSVFLFMFIMMVFGLMFWMVDESVFDGKLGKKFKRWAQSFIKE